MKKFYSLLIALAAGILADAQELPDYYNDYIAQRQKTVASARKDARDGFVFWTDTHIQANAMNAPALICKILKGDARAKVFWGGDCIPAFVPDIETWWGKQKELNDRISLEAKVFNIRGNHDFTRKSENKPGASGSTLSQAETSRLLSEAMTEDVVRNDQDPGGCYYYYDEPQARIRYVVFATTDDIADENAAFGTLPRIRKQQMDWIEEIAVGKAPADYSFVFLMHIPVILNDSPYYWRIRSFIDSVARSGRLLAVMGGHHHHDFQIYRNGTWWILTTSDACYQDFKRSPFTKSGFKRSKGTINEQAFDYVTIDAKGKFIKATRIGVGADRQFALTPVEVPTGKGVRLKAGTGKGTTWNIYDSEGMKFIRGPHFTGHWELSARNASISADGTVTGLRNGTAMAVAMAADSSRVEFFPIEVKQADAWIPRKAAFFGNSLIAGNKGFGMAATDCTKDYYYSITSCAKRYNPSFVSTKNAIALFERNQSIDRIDPLIDSLFLSNLAGDEDLISLQLGDNVNTPKARETFNIGYPRLLDAIKKKCPKAKIVYVGTWYCSREQCEHFQDMSRAAGCQVIDIWGPHEAEEKSYVGDVFFFMKEQNHEIKDVISIKENYPDCSRHNLTVTFKLKGKSYTSTFDCDNYTLKNGTLTYFSDQRVVDHAGVASHPSNEGFRKISDKFISEVFGIKDVR